LATIDYGGHRLELSADRLFRFAVVFVPDGKEFFAVEPVSHMNNGINRMHDGSDHGIVVLEPGAALEGGIRIARHGGDAP
jgi:aldose 1-epimerase